MGSVAFFCKLISPSVMALLLYMSQSHVIHVTCPSATMEQLLPLASNGHFAYGGPALDYARYVWRHAAIKQQPDQPLNLSEAIRPLQSKHTFTVINNYLGIDIAELGLPVVVRKPIPFVFKNEGVYFQIFWLQKSWEFCNQSCITRLRICQNEKSAVEDFDNLNTDHCIWLNHFKLSASGKQWNEIIDVDLYFPFEMLRNLYGNYVHVFRYNVGYNYSLFLPSSSPGIHILIDKERTHLDGFNDLLLKWMQGRLISAYRDVEEGPTNSYDACFYISVPENSSKLSKVRIILPSSKYEVYSTREITLNAFKRQFSLDIISASLFQQQKEQLRWRVIKSYGDMVLQGIEHYLRRCALIDTTLHSLDGAPKDKVDRLLGMIVSRLQTLMGNFSYMIGMYEYCRNGKSFRDELTPFFSPFEIDMRLSITPEAGIMVCD